MFSRLAVAIVGENGGSFGAGVVPEDGRKCK